eukprot:CFRG1764T1
MFKVTSRVLRLAGVPASSRASAAVPACIQRRLNHTITNAKPLTVFSDDETFIQGAVDTFVANEVTADVVAGMEADGCVRADIVSAMFENGFMGVSVPDDYNGTGSTFSSVCLVIESLAKADPTLSALCGVHNSGLLSTLVANGTQAQKQRFLPSMTTEVLCGLALSDPSIPESTNVQVTKENGQIVLNAKRLWCVSSGSQEIAVMGRDNDNQDLMFVLDRQSEGITMSTPISNLGLRSFPISLLDLDNVLVDSTRCIASTSHKSAVGDMKIRVRIVTAAHLLGVASGAYQSTMPYLYQREQFGTPIAHFQGMQHQRGQIATEMEAGRLMVYNAARKVEQGIATAEDSDRALSYANRIAQRTTSLCIEWMGGVGFTEDMSAEKYYRDTKQVMGVRALL